MTGLTRALLVASVLRPAASRPREGRRQRRRHRPADAARRAQRRRAAPARRPPRRPRRARRPAERAGPAGLAGRVRESSATSKDAELRSLARGLAAIYGDRNAIADMRKTLEDAAADVERAPGGAAVAPGRGRADAGQDAATPGCRHRPRARRRWPAWPRSTTRRRRRSILAAYAKFDVDARRVALNTLAGRLDYARPLAAAVQVRGRAARQDLTAFTIRQLRDLGDADLDAFVDEVYGVARDTSADKAAADRQATRQWLTDDRLANANPSRGRAVFAKTCAQCHALYGTGGTVGPDLTGSQRANLDYVLQNVVDPGALIAEGVPGHADPHEGQARRLRHRDARPDHAYKVVTRDRDRDGAEGPGRQGQQERPVDDARGTAERVERDGSCGPGRVPPHDEPGAAASGRR